MRVSELDPRVKNKRFFLPFLTLGTSTKLLGFMRFSAILDPLEISSGGQLFRPPTYPKGGKVSENLSARTCVSVLHRRERQLAAPGRELLCGSTRRCVAARAKPPSCLRQGRGAALQACRLLAFRKAGKDTVKLTARTRVSVLHRRGPQPPPQGAN